MFWGLVECFLWSRCLFCHLTVSDKALKDTKSTNPSQPVAWLHPFFIYHWIPDGTGITFFMPAVRRQHRIDYDT